MGIKDTGQIVIVVNSPEPDSSATGQGEPRGWEQRNDITSLFLDCSPELWIFRSVGRLNLTERRVGAS